MINFDRSISKKCLKKFSERTQVRNEREKINSDILRAWDYELNKKARPDLMIAHCISSRGSVSAIGKKNTNSPFLTKTVEAALSSWDVISACCTGAVLNSNGIMEGRVPLDIQLNLRVPVQNILGTHHSDVRFNNFSGLEGNVPHGRVLDKAALTESIFKGIERPNDHGFKMSGPYNILRHPNEFLRKIVARVGNYNEILLVGKTGVRMYMDFPCTEMIKLRGVSFRPNYLIKLLIKREYDEETLSKFEEDMEFIKKILRINASNRLLFPMGRHPGLRRLKFSYHIEKAGFITVDGSSYVLR